MKSGKGKATKPRATGAARKRKTDHRLVLLDQAALRRHATSECNKAMARLEKAKAEWKRFEIEDRAGYDRWMASTFGALQTRLREIEDLMRSKEAIIRAVEMEVFFGRARTHREAYKNVEDRRNNPPPQPDPHTDSQHQQNHRPDFENNDPAADDDDYFGEIEQELIFEDFLRSVMGINPDRMSQARYDKMFADFKAKAFGGPPPIPPEPEHEPPKPVDARIKELYRLLVRRLHPDSRADGDPAVSALWHEVQEAYNARNLDRLEMLLALTDLQANATSERTTLSQMRAVLAELHASFKALQRNLRAARKDPAWNFAHLQDRSKLEHQIRRTLESDLAVYERQLRHVESVLTSWSTPPKPRKPRPKRTQSEFLF